MNCHYRLIKHSFSEHAFSAGKHSGENVQHRPFLLSVLTASLGAILAGQLQAQTFTTLHNFNLYTNGANPESGLVLSGNALYGTTVNGGAFSNGTVFVVTIDGTGFTNLHSFALGALSLTGDYTNSGGFHPRAGLVLSGNTLFGTANEGGTNGGGTVFALNTGGTTFTTLYDFSTLTASYPAAPLAVSGNTLYGTTYANGTVFAVSTNGLGYTNLHTFAGGIDGANPLAGLVLSGGLLYGTAYKGGTNNVGTVFAVHTDSTGYTNIHTFTATSDGANPQAGLVLSGNTLYGTTGYGGTWGKGAIFAINTNGTGFTNLHSFAYLSSPTNSEGANPQASLVLSGNTLYGTTVGGGTQNKGTVFAINTDGTGFSTLYNFTGGNDGANPQAGLLLSGNSLYGTANAGGAAGNGTVFSLSFLPALKILHSGTNVILSWPTNVAGFSYSSFRLQSTTNLTVSSTWINVSSTPVVVNGLNTVTNPISGSRQFFRLTQ
jgi:uncharacterized repeat protein (TIGR03803 family)